MFVGKMKKKRRQKIRKTELFQNYSAVMACALGTRITLSLQALTLAGALMVLVLNEYDPLITPMTMSFGLSPLISF